MAAASSILAANQPLARYMSKGFDRIEGFCDGAIFHTLAALAALAVSVQAPGENELGGACEIGVHHGKFFLGLHALRPVHRSLAIDVFENQALNVDGSGRGDSAKFRDATARFAADARKIEIMARDSLSLGPGDVAGIAQRHGGFGFFSIDGGHTPVHVANDLELAFQLTQPPGFILVDDMFNPHWPGVAEGVIRTFCKTAPPFAPLLHTCNKLVLTGIDHHKRYFEALRDAPRESYFAHPDCRLQRFLGWDYLATFR